VILEERHHQRLIHCKLHGVDAEKLVVFHLLDRQFVVQTVPHRLDNSLDSALRVLENALISVRIVGRIAPRHLDFPALSKQPMNRLRLIVNIYRQYFTTKMQFLLSTIYPHVEQ